MMLAILAACLFQFVCGNNLAVTFKYDATKGTCLANCSTCSGNSTSTTTQGVKSSFLEKLLNTTRATQEKMENIQLLIENILESQLNNSCLGPIPTSCQDIKNRQPNSISGYYHIKSGNIYCNMGELCGSEGGWTRLAYLNMADSTENCPSGFRLYQSDGIRACGRASSGGASCASTQFPSHGISYSQVCGRVVGYQYASPDAVDNNFWKDGSVSGTDPNHYNISSWYVDGVSITRGSPRQHIWTLMAAVFSYSKQCPCSSGSSQAEQSFIGNHYFCESGAGSTWTYKLYTSDPLWDGQGCGSLDTACCSAPGIPWFHRDYGNATTTDYLELRVCGDQETADEDVPVGYYEIYVK